MSINYSEIANPSIRNLTPYQPGKPIEEVQRELGLTDVIKLASNENPLGPSPKALAAAQEALTRIHLYPDGGSYELKQALAKYLAVNSQQLTIGNGSENILEIIVKAYLNANNAAIATQYAFATIPLLIKAAGAKLITIPTVEWQHNIDATIAAITPETRIIFVVNPNNPTGTYTTKNDFNKLLNAVSQDILIVSDEAYSEYINQDDYPDTLKLLPKHPNLIISRTFSKIFGLAGLRIGYAISSPEIADILNRARLPFNSNLVGTAAACAALQDKDYIAKSISLNSQGRKQLEAGLKQLNITYIPSLANFITINIQQDAKIIYEKLLQKGVIVRPLNAYGLPTHLRVTIGTHEQNERFLKTLREIIYV